MNLSSYRSLRVAFLIGLAWALLASLLSGCASGTNEPRSQTAGDYGSANEVELAVLPVPEERRPAYKPPVEVLVTRDDISLPEGCRPWEVAGLLSSFFDAYNRGDQRELAGFFPERASVMHWLYGVSEGGIRGEERHALELRTREELLRYFAERHKAGESLRLLGVDVASDLERSEHAGITATLIRKATDLRKEPGGLLTFVKASIDCRAQQIALWNMDTPPPNGQSERSWYEPPITPCLPPESWDSEEAVLACARR